MTNEQAESLPIPEKSAAPIKRIVLAWTSDGGLKWQYCAAVLSGYGGDTIYLETPWGQHGFSRSDGRWNQGPCTNFVNANILDFDELERSIKDGSATLRYETDQSSCPGLDGKFLHSLPREIRQ